MIDGLLMVRESLLKLIFGQTNIKFVYVTGGAFNFGFVNEARSLTFSIQRALVFLPTVAGLSCSFLADFPIVGFDNRSQ